LPAALDKFTSSCLNSYDEAIRIAPGLSLAYNNRGIAYFQLGQTQRAIQDFDETIRLDPELGLAYGNRAIGYAVLNRDREAGQDIERAVNFGLDRAELEATMRDQAQR